MVHHLKLVDIRTTPPKSTAISNLPVDNATCFLCQYINMGCQYSSLYYQDRMRFTTIPLVLVCPNSSYSPHQGLRSHGRIGSLSDISTTK